MSGGGESLGMESLQRYPLSACRKVYVQRDYSQGLAVKFQTRLPAELEGKLESSLLEATIARLNQFYAEGEKVGARSAAETLFGCFTCYLSHLCTTLQYDRALERIAEFLRQENESVYLPRGLFLTDPIQRGLRVLEISLLSEPAPISAAPISTNPTLQPPPLRAPGTGAHSGLYPRQA